MRKYLILLVALAMVLGLSGLAMATLDVDTIDVTATVANYAAITGENGSVGSIELEFTGEANEPVSGTATIGVETNCNVNIAVSTTQLTLDGGIDTISTSVTIDEVAGPVTQNYSQGAGAVEHDVTVTGTTGAISGQSAGEYAATVTVTVSAAI